MSKRQKHFYSELVNFDDLFAELDLLDVTDSEKNDLADIARINLHQAIIDRILSELTDTDKKKFLELIAYGQDDKIWDHLHTKVKKIEEKISDSASQLKKELKEDIKWVKSQS